MKLYFDSNCPLCKSFAGLLKKHLESEIETVPLPQGEFTQDFKLELSNGEILQGKDAIDALEKYVPKIKDFFWMLPEAYKSQALRGTYILGKFWRKFFYFLRGKNCGECG